MADGDTLTDRFQAALTRSFVEGMAPTLRFEAALWRDSVDRWGSPLGLMMPPPTPGSVADLPVKGTLDPLFDPVRGLVRGAIRLPRSAAQTVDDLTLAQKLKNREAFNPTGFYITKKDNRLHEGMAPTKPSSMARAAKALRAIEESPVLERSAYLQRIDRGPTWRKLVSPGWLITGVAEMIPYVAGTAATWALAGPAAAGAVTFSLEYAGARDDGAGILEAAVVGTGNAVLELWGAARLLSLGRKVSVGTARDVLSKKVGKRAFRRLLDAVEKPIRTGLVESAKHGALEFFEEGIQEANQIVQARLFRGVLTPWPEAVSRMTEAGVLAGLTGGGMGVVQTVRTVQEGKGGLQAIVDTVRGLEAQDQLEAEQRAAELHVLTEDVRVQQADTGAEAPQAGPAPQPAQSVTEPAPQPESGPTAPAEEAAPPAPTGPALGLPQAKHPAPREVAAPVAEGTLGVAPAWADESLREAAEAELEIARVRAEKKGIHWNEERQQGRAWWTAAGHDFLKGMAEGDEFTETGTGILYRLEKGGWLQAYNVETGEAIEDGFFLYRTTGEGQVYAAKAELVTIAAQHVTGRDANGRLVEGAAEAPARPETPEEAAAAEPIDREALAAQGKRLRAEHPSLVGRAVTVSWEDAEGRSVQSAARWVISPAEAAVISNDSSGRKNVEFPQQYQDRRQDWPAKRHFIDETKKPETFDAERLGTAAEPQAGAPTIFPDQITGAANTRDLIVRELYAEGRTEYPEWLIENAAQWGFDPAKVRAMYEAGQKPILRRQLVGEMTDAERLQFVRWANRDLGKSLAPVDQARNDAERMTTDVLAKLQSKRGDISTSVKNPFVGAWLDTMSATERAELVTTDGTHLSQKGVDRLRAASLTSVYMGDTVADEDITALAALVDSAGRDENLRRIANALRDSVPIMGKLKARQDRGTLEEGYYPIPAIREALRLIRAAKEYQATMAKANMPVKLPAAVNMTARQNPLLGPQWSTMGIAFARGFAAAASSGNKTTGFLQTVGRALLDPRYNPKARSEDLFTDKPTMREIVDRAFRRIVDSSVEIFEPVVVEEAETPQEPEQPPPATPVQATPVVPAPAPVPPLVGVLAKPTPSRELAADRIRAIELMLQAGVMQEKLPGGAVVAMDEFASSLEEPGAADYATAYLAYLRSGAPEVALSIDSVPPGLSPTEGLAPEPPPEISEARPPAGASHLAPVRPASWARERAESGPGRKLVKRIQGDKEGRRVGMRSIIAALAKAVDLEVRIGREQTTRKRPARYEHAPHLARARTGNAIELIHEAGHGVYAWMLDLEPGWATNPALVEGLVELAQDEDGYASAEDAHEGMAEWVRRYVHEHDTVADLPITPDIEEWLQQHKPRLYRALRDAHRAYVAHTDRNDVAIFRAENSDVEKPGLGKQLESMRDMVLFSLSGGWPFHKIDRNVRRAIFKGVQSRGRAHKLAESWRKGVAQKMHNAHNAVLHIAPQVQMIQRKAGVQVLSTGEKTGPLAQPLLDDDVRTALETAGFPMPTEARHGQFARFDTKTIPQIVKDVGKGRRNKRLWRDFEVYGWMRTSLARWNAIGPDGNPRHLDYPGRRLGLTPERLAVAIADFEAENPEWVDSYKDIQKFMDALLVVAVMGGDKSVAEAIRMKQAYEDYWPMPRALAARHGVKPAGRATHPDAGYRRAYGSEGPITSILQAVDRRTREVVSAYYWNRSMLAPYLLGLETARNPDLPFMVRKTAQRVATRLNMDPKRAANLTRLNAQEVIAEFLNDQALRAKEGMDEAELERIKLTAPDLYEDMLAGLGEDRVRPGLVAISWAGKSIWRRAEPDAVNVVAPVVGGKRMFLQLEDPWLFNVYANTENPGAFLRFLFTALGDPVQPIKRLLTTNPLFVLRNPVRDVATALSPGLERTGPELWIPGAMHITGLVNDMLNLVGTGANVQFATDMLSSSLEHIAEDTGPFMHNAFTSVLLRGIAVKNWRALPLDQKLAKIPGQVTTAALKPFELALWAMGGMPKISEYFESLGRKGGAVWARIRGGQDEDALYSYATVTGHFAERPGSPIVAGGFRIGMFVNPGVQHSMQAARALLDPDPFVKGMAWAKLAWVSMMTALLWGINDQVTDEDDKEKLKERPTSDRAAYMVLFGWLRLPFAYSAEGFVQSVTWNALDEKFGDVPPADRDKMVQHLFKRLYDLPGKPGDLMQPTLKAIQENRRNYVDYWEDNVEPEWMKRRLKEDRAFPSTPQTYRWLAEHAPDWLPSNAEDWGPLHWQHFIRDGLGRVPHDTIRAIEMLVTGEGPKEPADIPFVGGLTPRIATGYSSEAIQQLMRMDSEWMLIKAQADQLMEAGLTDDEVEGRLYDLTPLHDAMLDIRDIGEDIREFQKGDDPRFTGMIPQLKQEMTVIGRNALNTYAAEVARKQAIETGAQ